MSSNADEDERRRSEDATMPAAPAQTDEDEPPSDTGVDGGVDAPNEGVGDAEGDDESVN